MSNKAFEFVSEEDETVPYDVSIKLNGEQFKLASDLTGMELLTAIADSRGGGDGNSTAAIVRFLKRVVSKKDWPRFEKATKGMKPRQFGELAGGVIDEYVAFPTTRAVSSSSGPSDTGATSEPDSERTE